MSDTRYPLVWAYDRLETKPAELVKLLEGVTNLKEQSRIIADWYGRSTNDR